MKELYNKITERLNSTEAEAAYSNANVAKCKYVDLYRGQYLNWEGYDTFPLPAVLFEFSASHEKGNGTAEVTLHLCYEQKRDTSNIGRSRDKALMFFNYVDVTHALLNCIESETTGKLSLIAEETVKQGTAVDVYTLTYECSYGRIALDISSKYTNVTDMGLGIEGTLVENPL